MNLEYNENQKYNLLIIDDEVEITKALTRQFRRKYRVFSTTSAEEGFDIMEKEKIQVVLSDQRMPGMSGVEFFARIKHKYPDALRLLLTGYSDLEAVVNAINEGQVFRYVTKPWNPVELDTIVGEAFEKYELITNNRKLIHRLNEANSTLEEKVKERTRELEQANHELSELNLEKNKYIGMVAHDLRNPIGVAASFTDIVIEGYDNLEKPKKLEYLGYVSQNCHFSLKLMNDFLDVSKIESGVFDLNLTEQDYVVLVRECVHQQSLNAARKSMAMELETSLSELNAVFDRNKMQQVLNNLIGNAIKYSPDESKVLIRVFLTEGSVVTEIQDFGQGIPLEEQSKLFKPFQTASSKVSADDKATGLGLAIVKKIVDAHNGFVRFESEVGKGTTFTVAFPMGLLPDQES